MAKIKWEEPYYKYEITNRKITIDVTRSIPPFKKQVSGLSDVTSEFKKKGYKNILDFGAGKLRNTLYLLNQGFKVWSVEFQKAFDTPAAKEMLAEASKFKGFFFLEYPHEFLKFQEELDAGILINVINIVPERRERRKILRECAKRIKRGGLLLLMTQYGEPHYRPNMTTRRRLNDGWCYNLHRTYQTFNKEYKIPELRDLVQKHLYKEYQKIYVNHHRALLFERK